MEACKEVLIERSRSLRLRNGQIWVVTLWASAWRVRRSYNSLPYAEQRKVFQPTPRGFRKVVLATSMAETSISIENITCVIDSGFETVTMCGCGRGVRRSYNKTVNMNTQVIQPISKVGVVGRSDSQATAQQRAGRAGRFTQGQCYRLMTEEDYEKLEKRGKPEVMRLLLYEAILLTRQLGIQNVIVRQGRDAQLDTFDLPSEISSSRYYIALKVLNLLDTLGCFVLRS